MRSGIEWGGEGGGGGGNPRRKSRVLLTRRALDRDRRRQQRVGPARGRYLWAVDGQPEVIKVSTENLIRARMNVYAGPEKKVSGNYVSLSLSRLSILNIASRHDRDPRMISVRATSAFRNARYDAWGGRFFFSFLCDNNFRDYLKLYI